MTPGGWLRWGRETPDAPAVMWDEGAWAWSDLVRLVDDWAAELERRGLRPGHTVELEATTTPGFVLQLLASWRLGAVVAPVFAKLTPPERDRQDRLLRPIWSLSGPGSSGPAPILET